MTYDVYFHFYGFLTVETTSATENDLNVVCPMLNKYDCAAMIVKKASSSRMMQIYYSKTLESHRENSNLC
jgi:hypothetical protein